MFYINLFLQSFALVIKWFCSRKLDFPKIVFFTNCDEMLNFFRDFLKKGYLCSLVHPECNVKTFDDLDK